MAQHPSGYGADNTGAMVEPSWRGLAGDGALPRSGSALATLRNEESPSGLTPELIAYRHVFSAKTPSAIILSIMTSVVYLAGVKVGLKPAVRTHVACLGHLPWPLPTTTAGAQTLWLRPRWSPKQPHLPQRPDVVGQPRRHRWR